VNQPVDSSAVPPSDSDVSSNTDAPIAIVNLAYDRLLAVSEAQRSAVCDELCAEFPEHAAALRRLSHDLSVADRALHSGLCPQHPQQEERTIGNYRKLRRLGEGAFGEVYLCAQTEPLRRQVAVKVLRPGASNKHTLLRFAAERQVLARLRHAAIAQVFDAGTLADGRPYLVMEYVDGAPITTHCDQRHLSVRARLDLFLALCDGVQHAHQKGVLHRDLKPSNVLVSTASAIVQPKVIDFGLAKVMQDEPSAGTQLTVSGGVLGTPGFMSPEQSEGRHEDVDTRADVFSLGVLLYLLLTGEMPWRERQSSASTSPPRPSARVVTSAASSAVAAQRAVEPRRLRSQLRGDLDWIVLRAIEHEPRRRYQSVQALADDLLRHVQHQPVLAGPPSTGYRLRKLVRRNRVAVAAAAAVLLSIATGMWTTWRYAEDARANLQRFEILAIGSRLARAVEEGRKVFPPWPEYIAAFDHWLTVHGRPMREELPRLRAGLAELRATAEPYTEADRALDAQRDSAGAELTEKRAHIAYLDSLLDHPAMAATGPLYAQVFKVLSDERDTLRRRVDALTALAPTRATWRLASPGQQFLHDTATSVERSLTEFCESPTSLLQVLERQRREIEAELVRQAERAESWQRVAREVAIEPRYGGLELSPQFGLVPLGRDPGSGWQEFYHSGSGPTSGEAPVRGPDGKLALLVDSGIVFVLLPGGRCLLGAQKEDPNADYFDPAAVTAEGPVHEVTLAPFLMGKHEVTQAQWHRLTGTWPSHLHRKAVGKAGPDITERHPVECVSWQECIDGLTKHGLDLPTEAQWEYACRAGAKTIWYGGDTAESLAGFEHLPFGEGTALRTHRAVGGLLPNPYGLHDMAGNVSEWCRDSFSTLAYLLLPRDGDCLRPVPRHRLAAARGSPFYGGDRERNGASSVRYPVEREHRVAYLGMRAMRRLVARNDSRR
jgi:serine/threonine protein kinase/formylglycine-generating enzyme required for sulfatase activity